MNIALVIENFDPLRGGTECWTWQFVRYLLRQGHTVHVISRQFARQVETLPIVQHSVRAPRGMLPFAKAAGRLVDRLSVDVVHDTGCGWVYDVLQPHGGSRRALFLDALDCLPAPLRPIKRLAWKLLPRYRAFDQLARRQYSPSQRGLVCAMSARTAHDLERLHGVPEEKIRLVYNGVDTVRFNPRLRMRYRSAVRDWLGVDDRTVLVLAVAHNYRLKGIPNLMRVVAKLVRSGHPLHLAVVGGKHPERYRGMVRRLGIGNNVTLVGTVSDAAPFYAAADIFAHPTYYDACSLVVMEAMACGLPVITTSRNGASEIITDGVEGLVYSNPNDLQSLRQAIERLLDSSVRKDMGEAGRELACRYNFQRNALAVEELYYEITERHEARFRRLQVSPLAVSRAL